LGASQAAEADLMPTGRLKAGRVRVAGVTTVEVREELEAFQRETKLPSLSQTVGETLKQWRWACRSGVVHPAGPQEGPEPSADHELAGASRRPRERGLAVEVRIEDLKEFVRARFPADYPLREVLQAEKDVLGPEEFLAKMEVWAVLLNRRA